MSTYKLTIMIAAIALVGCSDQPSQQAKQTAIDPSLCQFSTGDCQRGQASFSLSPQHAPSEQPLQLKLTLPDGQRVVAATIAGRDMYMGEIPVTFKDGKATAIYGSCSSDYMVWRMSVKIEDADGKEIVQEFDWLADNN